MKWIRIFLNSPANPSNVWAIRLIRHVFCHVIQKNALPVSILLDQLPLLSLFYAGDSIKKWVWYHDPDFLLLILGLHYYYLMKARMVLLRPKKSSLVSINRPGENFFNHPPAHIVECVSSEYIFLI